jgi:hypothetical protein
LKRLTKMSWDEVRTRATQAVRKRTDYALYLAGLANTEARFNSQLGSHQESLSGAHAARSHSRSKAKFFFAKTEARHRAELVRKHLPNAAQEILEQAEEICRHEFRLLGYEKIHLGDEIDWYLLRGMPCTPWYKIKFLDFDEIGDHKLVWELGRHQHLVILAKAWSLTGDFKYVNELVGQWYSWQKANPYPLGIHWASTLEVGFRSLSWLWVRNLLGDCGGLPDYFSADLVRGLYLNGRHVERYLSTYFSPNTHLLGEAVALFFIGTLCPELAPADGWRNRGWEILLRECERQVRVDGVYFEQTLYYHVYALDFWLHARILATENGMPVSEQFDDVLKKMLDVVQALAAFGPIEGFGDDDGGRVFDGRRNRAEHMTDPLAMGTVLYGKKYPSTELTEESIWLFGDRAIDALLQPAMQVDAGFRSFPAGGIYMIGDLKPCTQQMMIDGGPQGAGASGHGHADALSIRYSLDWQRVLIDLGTYRYVSGGNERDLFRGTGAHNTLRIDGEDQAIAERPFVWSSLPHVMVESWLNGETFDFFVGSHDGYCRLSEPVVHRRYVFHVKGGWWLVRDAAEGQGSHLLEIFWHFAPEIELQREGSGIIAGYRAIDKADPAYLKLLFENGSQWKSEIVQGFVSPAYGAQQDAKVLRISTKAMLPADCGMLLVPGAENSERGSFEMVGDVSGTGVRGYRYRTSESIEFVFFAEKNIHWTCGNWSSNASLLYCKLQEGRFAQIILTEGSFAEWRGRRFVSHLSSSEVFEWMRQSQEALGPHGLAVNDFEVLEPAL